MKPNVAFFALTSMLASHIFAETFSAEELNHRTIQRRAVEAVIWGMPAVNFDRLLQAAIQNGGGANHVIYWSRPVNSKNQTLTPDPDTIYFMPYYDTTNGPVVREIQSRSAEERGRLSRHLLRSKADGRKGIQLGADRSEAAVRIALPPVRPEEGAVRKDVEAAGCPGSEVRKQKHEN